MPIIPIEIPLEGLKVLCEDKGVAVNEINARTIIADLTHKEIDNIRRNNFIPPFIEVK